MVKTSQGEEGLPRQREGSKRARQGEGWCTCQRRGGRGGVLTRAEHVTEAPTSVGLPESHLARETSAHWIF